MQRLPTCNCVSGVLKPQEYVNSSVRALHPSCGKDIMSTHRQTSRISSFNYSCKLEGYPSTACHLNYTEFEYVFPAYHYCLLIFMLWKHVLSGCPQTPHCIYSTWNMAENLPCLLLILNQALQRTPSTASDFILRTQDTEASCNHFCNNLPNSAFVVEWVQSFRVRWGKQFLQNWKKGSPLETNHPILLGFCSFFLHSFHLI